MAPSNYPASHDIRSYFISLTHKNAKTGFRISIGNKTETKKPLAKRVRLNNTIKTKGFRHYLAEDEGFFVNNSINIWYTYSCKLFNSIVVANKM